MNMVSMCAVLKICWLESKARPDSSLSMRSGLSCMIVFNFTCLSELCQRGTRWSMWTHAAALPSSMHLRHASCTLMLVNKGSPVVLSRILSRRV